MLTFDLNPWVGKLKTASVISVLQCTHVDSLVCNVIISGSCVDLAILLSYFLCGKVKSNLHIEVHHVVK